MIISFRDEWLPAFFTDDVRSRNIPSDLEDRLFRKLQMLDDATTDQDLRVPRPAITLRSSEAVSQDFIPFASTSNGALSFGGRAPKAKHRAFISTTTATDNAGEGHADD